MCCKHWATLQAHDVQQTGLDTQPATRRRQAPNKNDPDFALSADSPLLGEVARRQGDFSAAEKSYREEVGISRRRISADPASVEARSALTGDLLHLADVLIQRGDTAGAKAALDEILADRSGNS